MAKSAPKLPSDLPTRPGKNGGRLLSGREKGHKGAGGRPPSALREQMRGSLEKRIKIAERIADAPGTSDSDRLRALDFLAKYGLGTTQTATDTEGRDATPPGRLSPQEMRAELLAAFASERN